MSAVLAGPDDVPGAVLLDVRWALGRTDGREQHRVGHLPGAVYVDLDTELAAPPSPAEGRHPLPSVQSLQAAAQRWGISAGSRVIAYDATGGLAAARAWWLLRWGGLADVAILDGGLQAWPGPLETGDVQPVPGDVQLIGGHLPVFSIDQAAAWPSSGLLLDARAAERYRGEVEPVDPRPGHVPGAVSAPTTDNLGADGRFLPAAALSERFAALGAADQPVGAYCGSGVTAAHTVAALAHAGIEASLWPGSWSQWAADSARPAATGE